MNKPIFRSAITDEAGDVDVGYLALLVGLIGWATSGAVVLLVGIFVAWRDPTAGAETIQSMGVAIGAVSGGFAAMLGAVGLFRMGDKPHAGTTTTTRETVTESPQAAIPGDTGKPLPVSVVKMPATSAPPERGKKAKR